MMRARVIPCLLLKGRGLVKTVKFRDPTYLGDPRNTVKIFNEKEVDELVLLDIVATPEGRRPQFELVREIVSEAFMPIAYGGGLRSVDDCKRMFAIGIEKVVVNSHAVEDPSFITQAVTVFGSQSVVLSMDVKRSMFNRYDVYTHGARRRTKLHPVEYAKEMEERGVGEVLLNAIHRDGTMAGYDLELIKSVTDAVGIPVVVCGGAKTTRDLAAAVFEGGASAAAAGSMFVFHGKHRAVLISFPEPKELDEAFGGPAATGGDRR